MPTDIRLFYCQQLEEKENNLCLLPNNIIMFIYAGFNWVVSNLNASQGNWSHIEFKFLCNKRKIFSGLVSTKFEMYIYIIQLITLIRCTISSNLRANGEQSKKKNFKRI